MSNVWATMPYVQLSHKRFVNYTDNRQSQLFSEMSLRDVMELPGCVFFDIVSMLFLIMSFSGRLGLIINLVFLCIVDLKTNNPHLYHVMSPIKCLAIKKWFQSLPLQGCLASKN